MEYSHPPHAVSVEFPLRGEWRAFRTPAAGAPTHGTDFLGQRYAYDFVRTTQRRWAPFGPNVFVHLFVGVPVRITPRDWSALVGNHVVIESEEGFAVYAHLRRGSVRLRKGQHVVTGDVIGDTVTDSATDRLSQHMITARQLLAATLLAGAAACAGRSQPDTMPLVSDDFTGNWGQNFGAPRPATSVGLSLSVTSGNVIGAGFFSDESGAFGELRPSGTVTETVIQLQVVYILDPTAFPDAAPDTATFVGALATRDRIIGTMVRRGSNQSLVLTRSPELIADTR